jgi:hypothetical protein
MTGTSNEIKKLSYVDITYDAPVVYFRYKKDAQLGFPEIRELIASAEKISGHKPYVTFSDVREGLEVTNEGKKVFADPGNMPLFRGTAVLVSNNMYKFAVDFMNTFNRPKFPFRAFVSEEKAIEWLRSLPL